MTSSLTRALRDRGRVAESLGSDRIQAVFWTGKLPLHPDVYSREPDAVLLLEVCL